MRILFLTNASNNLTSKNEFEVNNIIASTLNKIIRKAIIEKRQQWNQDDEQNTKAKKSPITRVIFTLKHQE